MEHMKAESREWAPSGQEHFTGTVWNSRVHDSEGGITMIAVQFAPGARSDWHTHPGGQLLYVVSGSGLVQTGDGVTQMIGPGDVVHAPPGERHWHGAAPASPMMHLSLTSGGATQWEGKVGEEDYLRR
jgi:quercetin dioxygenase-like cupin family protein